MDYTRHSEAELLALRNDLGRQAERAQSEWDAYAGQQGVGGLGARTQDGYEKIERLQKRISDMLLEVEGELRRRRERR